MSEPFEPQRMGRVLHLAMEEILGAEGARSLLECAGLPATANGDEFIEDGHFSGARLGRVLSALEQQYGAAAGRGVAQRIGRACFPYGLREYGKALGVTTTSFRLLPFPGKLKTFAAKLAEMFNSISADCIQVTEGEGKLEWRMERCPFCEGQQAEHALCALPAGVAEEALYWLSGGKMFRVEETACIGRGEAACVLQVDKVPLDS